MKLPPNSKISRLYGMSGAWEDLVSQATRWTAKRRLAGRAPAGHGTC